MKDIVLSSIDELAPDWLSRILMTEVVAKSVRLWVRVKT